MESTFAGIDFGKDKGYHLSTLMLESLGRDLCRTVIVYKNLKITDSLNESLKSSVPEEEGKSINEILIKQIEKKMFSF